MDEDEIIETVRSLREGEGITITRSDGTEFTGVVEKIVDYADSDSDRVPDYCVYLSTAHEWVPIEIDKGRITATVAPTHMNDTYEVVSVEGAIIPKREFKVYLSGPAGMYRNIVSRSRRKARLVAKTEANENSSHTWSVRDVEVVSESESESEVTA